MITSRFLSPDRSLALEFLKAAGDPPRVEVVWRSCNRLQKLPYSNLLPRGPVLFSKDNDVIIFHEGTSSMGCWPVALRRGTDGLYERLGDKADNFLCPQLAANLPNTARVARMWIFARKLMPKGKVEASAAVSAGRQRIEGRFQFVYDLETLKIETIFVSPELTEARDYWGAPHSTGSGFFISRDGLILTAKHVIENAEAVFVQNFDGRRYRAEIVETGYYDAALLKVQAEAPSIVPISPGAKLEIGQKLLTTGFPVNVADPGFFWDNLEFSEGSVSSLRTPDGASENFQFSAPIRPGNSGGAIVFENGTLAGIAVAGYDPVRIFADKGFTALLVNIGLSLEATLLILPPFWIQESPPL